MVLVRWSSSPHASQLAASKGARKGGRGRGLNTFGRQGRGESSFAHTLLVFRQRAVGSAFGTCVATDDSAHAEARGEAQGKRTKCCARNLSACPHPVPLRPGQMCQSARVMVLPELWHMRLCVRH